MQKTYFRFAWRHLARARGFSFINVLGLAVGLSACLFIFQICIYEFSFDRFHPNGDRIYRGVTKRLYSGDADWSYDQAISSHAAHAIRDEYSGIEQIANFYSYSVAVTVPAPKGRTPVKLVPGKQYDMIITDPSWFAIFHYQWLAGSPATALNDPFTVVLTAARAKAFFGDVPAATLIGRKLIYDDSLTLTVSGIVSDWDRPTDLHFTDFISFSTVGASFLRHHKGFDDPAKDDWGERTYAQTYILLRKGQTPADFEAFTTHLIATHVPKQQIGDDKLVITLQPLADLHFDARYGDFYSRKAHRPTLYAIAGVAVFILLLAIINFINLSAALALARAKEVGTRKILGSGRRGIVIQFVTETSLILLLALALSPFLITLGLTCLKEFIPPDFGLHVFLTPGSLGSVLVVFAVTLLLAGGYPAYILSGFSPALSLKGQATAGANGRQYLRQFLIVFQFTISLSFIIATIVVGRQLHFLLHKDLGVNQAGIINVDLDGINPNLHYSDENKQVLATAVSHLQGVQQVSLNLLAPTQKGERGFMLKDLSTKTQLNLPTRMGDEQYVSIYGLKIIAGRNIRVQNVDTSTEFLLSEKAAGAFGYTKPQMAIGRTMTVGGRWTGPVVGIVADFSSQSLIDPIKPVYIMATAFSPWELTVKLDPANRAVIPNIEKAFKTVYPTELFRYSVFKDEIVKFYAEEQRLSTLINTAMAIAIFISCMGLFGLAAFTAGRRTKEISIRKVLGATVPGIIALLTRQFLKLVVIAFVISVPIAWYCMNKWLLDYANRIAIAWWMFAIAGFAAVVLTLLTVGFHTLRAAIANPVNALRNE